MQWQPRAAVVRHLRPGAGGAAGPDPGQAGEMEGRARGGRRQEASPSLSSSSSSSSSRQVGAGTQGGGQHCDRGRGRAALESHWRTRPPEADK